MASKHVVQAALLFACACLLNGCGTGKADPKVSAGKPPTVVRLGHFANVTHAQALVGVARGDFQKALGQSKLDVKIFNAGPSVIEAIFAEELDLAYIGPGPAINGYAKSNGAAVRIISGSAANGVGIVVRPDSGIEKLEALAGKRIATPQLGNTQDLSAKHYLTKTLGLQLKKDGGDTDVVPIANADQLGLFKSGQIDAAWAPEPWASRLVHEANGKLIADEKDLWPDKRFCTVVLLASTKFLKEHPQTAEAFRKAHAEVTAWINANRQEAAELANKELNRLTSKALAPAVLADSFARTEFTTDPLMETVQEFAVWSRDLGFAKEAPDLKGLFELSAPATTASPSGKDKVTVVLVSFPAEKKISVIKAVREATGLGLKEAKDIADQLPHVVKSAVLPAEAETLKRKLEAAGATVEIK